MARIDHRYTAGRRAIVEALERAARPLTVPDVVDSSGARLAQSSVYRNLTVLLDAGVLQRVAGADDLVRFEIADDLAGHHHHLVCTECGSVADVTAAPRLERALTDAARLAAEETGFEVTEHRIDLVGVCAQCR